MSIQWTHAVIKGEVSDWAGCPTEALWAVGQSSAASDTPGNSACWEIRHVWANNHKTKSWDLWDTQLSLCLRGAVKEDTPWLENWERVWKLIYHSFMSNLLPNIWCIKFLKYGDLPPSHYCNISQKKNSAVWQQQHYPGLWNEEMIHPYFKNQTFKTQRSL